jgi:putative hydrolase of the HAD superfamily
MLKPYIEDQAAFISRFVELDANGTVWKDNVYSSLIDEFYLEAWSCEELLSVYESCFCAFSVPRPGVLEALDTLSTRYKIGLISNGMTPFQERNFRGLGIASMFGSVIVSAAVNMRKPDSAIFHLACSELGVRPEESVYVGDNPIVDIGGARDAGLRTIFVPSSAHPHCGAADATCHDMIQLPRIIEEIGEQVGAPNP